MIIHATVGLVIKNKKVLLIKKSHGRFGEGKWSSLGGKLEKNEAPEECIIREIFEESGLKIGNPKNHGLIEFYEDNELSWIAHVFSATNFSGKIKGTDEGILKWFDTDGLPLEKMWEDNRYWIPLILEGKGLNAKFHYTRNFEKLLSHEVRLFSHEQEKEIQKMIEKLKTKSFENLEDHATNKRLEWFENNKNKLNLKGPEVRKGYGLLLEYMKLIEKIDPKKLQIVEETKEKIVWRSFNFCPVIEACKRLGLDTREICKKVYEKPTQVFIEQLNPKLRFGRSYEKIRPYYDYCEEWIELIDD